MSRRETIPLPIPADLSYSAVVWAAELLGEVPETLWVTSEEKDRAQAIFGDLNIGIDDTLQPDAWSLEGPTRRVDSEGA